VELKIDLNGLNDSEMIVRAQVLLSILSTHPAFQEGAPLPSMVPNLIRLRDATDKFREAYNAALTHDVVKVGERKSRRKDLHQIISSIGQFAVVLADGDPDELSKLGYEARRQRGSASNGPLGVLSSFTVRHGDHRGTMIGKVAREPGAGSYEVQVTEGDPTLEEGWKFKGVFLHCSRMEMNGFEPGKNYSFRVRGIGSQGPGPWSAVVSLFAI